MDTDIKKKLSLFLYWQTGREMESWFERRGQKHISFCFIQPRMSGLAKGLIQMSKDFDEPLEDFTQYR